MAVLDHVFLDGDPAPRPGVEWDFHTAPPLTVEAVLPDEAGFLTDFFSSFTVSFNRPVEPESAVSRFSLAVVGGHAVEGEFSWRQDGAVLVFQPKDPLEPAMQYQLTVGSGIQDMLGYKLEESQQLFYTTPIMMGLPLPIRGSRGVALDSTIRVPFARPMDRESVEAGLVISPALEGDMLWEEDTLLFIPRGGLAPETVYQLLVRADVRDATGAPLAQARRWSFETEPFLAEVLTPSEAVVTELQQPIEFTFALPMNRASVDAGLTISPSTPGELVWSDEDRTVAFEPGPAWLAGAEYEISIDGSARTADGYQTLGEDVGYAFSTGVAEVRFGEGPNVQVVATTGDRAVQVVAQGADVGDFRMHAITATQFLELYDSGYGASAARTPALLAAIEMTPTVSWREPLAWLGDQMSGNWQPAEAHIPAEVLPGLYVLTADPASELQGQLLVVLTDHVLVLKRALVGTGSRAEAEIVAWDTAIRDSSPVMSATVRFYGRDAALFAEGVTNGDGLLALSMPGDPAPTLVLSEKDGDVTVAGLDGEWGEGEVGPVASRSEYLVYTFTDQPIYRPAGTIHFKQVVRVDDDVQYALPVPGQPITVRLRDPRDNIAASQVLTTTEFGTAFGSFEITDRPMVGRWSFETEVDGILTRTPIEVVGHHSALRDAEARVPRGASTPEASRGVEIAGQAWTYAASDQALWQQAQEGEEFPLSVDLDRQAYAAGEEAQIVASTPISGTALISLERGRIHHVETVDLVSGTNLISVPVEVDYAPNVDLTVHQYGPSGDPYGALQSQPEIALQTARAQLLVPMDDRMLTLAITTEQDIYSPGEAAIFQIRATDHQGEPVVAEISLALVDEDLYASAAGQVPDFFDALYGPRPNLVQTYDSMRPTRWFSSEERVLDGEGEEEDSITPEVFEDTAIWAPAMMTDARGEAELAVQMPDSLTTWRAIARAVTTDTKVGEATAQLVVAQDIAVRPMVPDFLVHGDAFSMTAAVHNYASQPVSATVEVEQEGLRVWNAGRQILHVPAEGVTTAVWTAVAEGSGEAQVSLRATASRGARLVGRDVAQVSLQVHPLALPESVTWAGELTPDNPAATISLTVPADMITSSGQLEIGMAPSAVPAIHEGVAYLIEYPFDCVEQTVGKVLAGAVVADGFGETSGPARLLEADLSEVVQLDLQKLYGYQNDEGGWGWWGDRVSDVYQTAYVLHGLARIREAGFSVDEGVVERGAKALRLMLAESDPGVQAQGAYALAMLGEPATLTLTVTDILQMDPFSQAALAIAIDVAGEEDSDLDPSQELGSAVLENLEQSAIEEATTAYWEEGGGGESAQGAMGSPERTTAMVVQALVRLDPENALLPKAIRWLMSERERQGWGDTQRTSYAILALADYVRSTETEPLTTGFQVLLNGEIWQEGQIEPLQGQEVLTVPLSALAPGEHEVQVVLGSEGTAPRGVLYYAATATWQVAAMEGDLSEAEGQEPGIGVRREYRVHGGEEPATEFGAGSLVEVAITLDVPQDSWHIVIEDRLPAGFEALDEQSGGRQSGAGESVEPTLSGATPGYDPWDVGADRVVFFFEQLGAGSHSFTYLVQAVTTGSFTALPALVYPMYDSEAWSRSASAHCQVRPR
jgi:uncharacterized protein YfaS (alpha-2-macroglobulin family)